MMAHRNALWQRGAVAAVAAAAEDSRVSNRTDERLVIEVGTCCGVSATAQGIAAHIPQSKATSTMRPQPEPLAIPPPRQLRTSRPHRASTSGYQTKMMRLPCPPLRIEAHSRVPSVSRG